jgi:hypothetical protein
MDTRLFPLLFAMSFFLMDREEMENLAISSKDQASLTLVCMLFYF